MSPNERIMATLLKELAKLNAAPSDETAMLILMPALRREIQRMQENERKGRFYGPKFCSCETANCGCRYYVAFKKSQEPLPEQADPATILVPVIETYTEGGEMKQRTVYRIRALA